MKYSYVNVTCAYLCWFPFGILGAHRYYLGDWKGGLLWTFTLGFFVIGWIVDGINLSQMCQDYNEAVFNQQQLDHDATILDDGVNYWQPIGAPEAGAVGQKPHYVQPGAGGRGGGGEALLPAGGGLY